MVFPRPTFEAAWQQITPGHVRVVYTITEGGREFVRDILISGLRTTRQSLVMPKITLKPGDPLSPVAQTNIQESLYDLGVFAAVETAIENPDGDTSHKNVIYHFQEANRYTISVGFGAQVAQFRHAQQHQPCGRLEEPSASAPRDHSRVSRLNFLGLGHTVSCPGRVFFHRAARFAQLLAAAPGRCRWP